MVRDSGFFEGEKVRYLEHMVYETRATVIPNKPHLQNMDLSSVRQHKSGLYHSDNGSYSAEWHLSRFGEMAVGSRGQG